MINTLMSGLATYLGVDIILENQDAPTPLYPFGAYNIVRTDFEHPHQRIRTQTEEPDNMVEIKNYYGSSVVVRLSFYNKGNTGDLLDAIMTLARSSWMWLHEEGREICRANNVVPAFISPEIKQEEQSPEKDNKFRVGFDFALKSTLEHTSSIESIIGVDYTFEVKT